ncbi:MAG: glycosyltransferase family 4 protein [Gaiellaceae bacterium]
MTTAADRPLRAAFLTHTPPLPAVSGERIRNWNLMHELARRGWSVSLFGLLDPEKAPSPEDRDRLEGLCDSLLLQPLAIPSLRRRGRMLRDLALGRAFHSSFLVSREAASACRRWLHDLEFDVLVIETHYMAPFVPQALLGRAVFDSHNSEARRIATMAAAHRGSAKGVVARLQYGPVRRFERRVLESVSRVTAVSLEEARYFEPYAPGRVDLVPNGVDCSMIRPRSGPPASSTILFLGSLDYSANVEALAHLADGILPRLEGRQLSVDVIGSHPREEVYAIARRSRTPVHVVGQVADTTPYWQRARALVVPLRVGGGTRLKILEALARGVPVVTTTLGCEGLELESGEDLLVADRAGDFAACIERLLDDDALSARLARKGRATVEERYDWRQIGDLLERSLLAAVAS